jgi:predicted AlkP superfamily pyrophosphatase or phosphodiesterase
MLARAFFLAFFTTVVVAGLKTPSKTLPPHLILVSFDGFRHDYVEKFGANNLMALREAGASAEGLIPVFPSNTFPNHYTIITGMYPVHHGVVDNSFFDPVRQEKFFFKSAENAGDGRWFGGTPLWVLAERAGMRTATMHWVGSEAEIQGVRPTYWSQFDANITPNERVDRVLGWLNLPEAERPRLVTLYADDVDLAGHRYGPDAPETRSAALALDAALGRLLDGIRATGLPVNVVVVSDHGMLNLAEEPVYLGGIADLSQFEISANGANVMLYSKDEALVHRTYRALRESGDVDVYRRTGIPARLRYSGNERVGDLLVCARGARILSVEQTGSTTGPKATHSFDPAQFPEMKGIFYAMGPNIRKGTRLRAFENVHIFPLLARILGINTPRGVDARSSVLQPIFRR